MDAMPRPRPPNLHMETTRHGKTVWYVRIGKGPRIRIHAVFGTPEFDAKYRTAVSGEPAIRRGSAKAGTLTWLITRYRESTSWTDYSLTTRKQREGILRQIMANAGDKPYASITEAVITAGRDRRSTTPFQARHFIDTMRGLFEWAKNAKLVKENPATPVRYPLQKKGDGFPVWSEEDVSAYEARWPLGTRERVWLAVLLYTGMRRGDAVRLGRQHIRHGVATIKTEKSGFTMEITIPLLPPLLEALRAGPTGELAFICGVNGMPLTKESFGNNFRDACRAATIKKSAHGVRKIGATRAANNGATVAQLEAIFGWTGGKMASLYTQSADRRRLAREAIGKLVSPGVAYLA